MKKSRPPENLGVSASLRDPQNPQGKPALVPKLRFPEFCDADGWDVEFLGGICQPQQWTTISATDLVDEGYPVYGANGFIGYYSEFNHEFETVAVTCRGSTCGEVSLIPPKSYITGNSMCLDGIDPVQNSYHFLYQLLKHRGFDDVISGSAQPQIVGSAIKRLRIALPTKPEQQKLAECLSSVDELMAAQARKVDALKTHKKGLMQQLFPREGETQPRLRFPEFQNAAEWEEHPLKKVFSIFQGFAFSSNDSVERGCRWLKIADVGIQLMNHDAPSFLPEDHKERFSKFAVREGDYVVALTRPILSGQLKIAKVDDIFDGALLNQRVGQLITSQHPAFVFLLLQTRQVTSDIEKSISGNDPPNLSAQQIEGIKTHVPRLPEQQRIADCLTSLDDLIAAQTQKHEALKTHKKGLMQQLFPSPDAPTS